MYCKVLSKFRLEKRFNSINIKLMKVRSLNKKFLYFVVVLSGLIFLFVAWYWSKFSGTKEIPPPLHPTQNGALLKQEKEKKIKEQLEFSNQEKLLSQEEIKKQLHQLNKGHPLSEEKIKKQLEELNQ